MMNVPKTEPGIATTGIKVALALRKKTNTTRTTKIKDRPTAIFGSNDEIAAGVLAAAKSSGLEVPYDLSIAGFEDSPFSKQSWPALTTAKQATEAFYASKGQ